MESILKRARAEKCEDYPNIECSVARFQNPHPDNKQKNRKKNQRKPVRKPVGI